MVATPAGIDARLVVRGQFKLAHEMLEGIMADCADIANTRVPGANIATIAPIYAHALTSEDFMVNQQAAGGALLLVSDGWDARLGIRDPHVGLTSPTGSFGLDLDLLRTYAAAVYRRTDEFLATATEDQLRRGVQSPTGSGPVPAIDYLAAFGVVHVSEHAGEIAALKGVHGRRGLPF